MCRHAEDREDLDGEEGRVRRLASGSATHPAWTTVSLERLRRKSELAAGLQSNLSAFADST